MMAHLKADWFFLYVVAVILVTAAMPANQGTFVYLIILANLLKFVLPVLLLRYWLRKK
jgi:hypothetical protein